MRYRDAAVTLLWRAVRDGSGGVTVDALTSDDLPQYGYFVGGQSWTLVRAAHMVTRNDIVAYVSAHPSARYFGIWVDDGRAYLDTVDHVSGANEAYELARERKELAIFNIETGECEKP